MVIIVFSCCRRTEIYLVQPDFHLDTAALKIIWFGSRPICLHGGIYDQYCRQPLGGAQNVLVFPFIYMKRVEFMSCTTASHQGVLKRFQFVIVQLYYMKRWGFMTRSQPQEGTPNILTSFFCAEVSKNVRICAELFLRVQELRTKNKKFFLTFIYGL